MFDKYSNSFLRDFNFDYLLGKFEKNCFLNFERGEFIYFENELISNIYFILSGGIFLIKKRSESSDKIILKYGKGDVIGLEDTLLGKCYSSSAFVSGNANVLAISKDDFLKITRKNDDFNLWVLKYLSNKIISMSETIPGNN